MKPLFACSFVLTLFVAGCGSDALDPAGDAGIVDGEIGGAATTGGRSAVGSGGASKSAMGGAGQGGSSNSGVPTPVGVGGGEATGGSIGTSDVSATGGAAAQGGAAAIGGAAAQGGADATGGATAQGGAAAIGGATAQGGAAATGGAAAQGGAAATGGAQTTGGAVSTGSAQTTGGAVSTGSAQTTGGAETTGSAVAMGGGQTTGGVVSTGGVQATGGACSAVYYRDADGDTWGGTETSCVSGSGWVTRTGDCDDRNADVFPDQSDTFELPYNATNGTQSFDYDCDGEETLAGGTQPSTGACVASGFGNACAGDGYLPVEPVREGEDLNQVCGSMRYLVCSRNQQVCIEAISTDGTYEAARCK